LISTSIHALGSNNTEIKTTKLTDNAYILEGSGGNIGILDGGDGVFIIDDLFALISGKNSE
jgi:cyclase